MTLAEYARQARLTAVYATRGLRDARSLGYAVMGLAGETGKLADCLKKVDRDDDSTKTPERTARAKHLLGGVLWYWAALCYELRLDPEDVAGDNLKMLADRSRRDVIRGDGWRR